MVYSLSIYIFKVGPWVLCWLAKYYINFKCCIWADIDMITTHSKQLEGNCEEKM